MENMMCALTINVQLREYGDSSVRTVINLPSSPNWQAEDRDLHEVPSSTIPSASFLSGSKLQLG